MQFSKVGVGSLLIGLLVLAGVWYFVFQSLGPFQAVLSMAAYALIGGLVWLGVVLTVLGVLMLVV